MQKCIQYFVFAWVVVANAAPSISQTMVAAVDSANALSYGNSRKLVVGDNGTVSLVFHDQGEIFYSESSDHGLTWTIPVNLSLNAGTSQFPALAIDSLGRKHVVWQDNTLPGGSGQFDNEIRIFYKNFIESGNIPGRFADVIGECAGDCINPSIAVDDNGKLYAAWAADMRLTVGWEVNYSEGTLIGNASHGFYDWTLPEIPGSPLGLGISFFPSVDVDADVVFIPWLEHDATGQLVNLIRFRDSNGWSELFDLSFQAIGPFSNSRAGIPSLVALGDSTTHVVFQEALQVQNNTFNDVFYLRYQTDDTLTFELGENVSKTALPSTNPVIISDGDRNLYVAWEQELGGVTDIFTATRNAAGWSAPKNISLSEVQSVSPQIAVTNDDSLLVVWLEGDGPPHSLVAKKTDALVTSVRDFREHAPALETFQLFRNYPNPFNAGTSIRYFLPMPAPVGLFVFNIRGQLVRTLFDGSETAGFHTVSWDGKNDTGASVASGVYVVILRTQRLIKARRAVFLK